MSQEELIDALVMARINEARLKKMSRARTPTDNAAMESINGWIRQSSSWIFMSPGKTPLSCLTPQ